MMRLIINGDERLFPTPVQTVDELLNELKLANKMVIVEHNEHILQKHEHQQTELQSGDRLEIVHFVGGG
ncbi:thiamine biosynthesis protein ThiS [Paenibacillus hunanensis]|uniref:Thiamine biosynthesis protein ThiS n=2 Tax=Paenibacillus hunanensis TaxID=539262 RepID=A0ABU1J2B1_9BACL|nr:thiamine biosynthesis protein ThiS [Paenibacillus hunanensis]